MRSDVNNLDAHAAAATTAWLISFGDLLTLLVCFFLVLTPWAPANGTKNGTKSTHRALEEELAIGGTSFANPSVGPKPGVLAELPISVSDMERSDGQGVLRLVEQIASVSKDGSIATLRVCEGTHRDRAMQELGPQVKAAVAHGASFRLEVAGDCGQFEVLYPIAGEMVGTVRIQSK